MKYLNFFFNFINLIIIFPLYKVEEIPESFDSRQKWPNCIPKIYNQGGCGSCYAISTATTFSTRFCIKNNKTELINFSPQNLVNCLSGCQGEFPDIVWDYINKNGITTDKCLSYQGSEKSCSTKCDSKEDKFKKYYSGTTKFLEDEDSIKKEIMENGPVTSMMNLYKDYYDYKSGIYIHTGDDDYLGFHAISIIGWGIEDNIKYWIIQDSYGISHGENGYLRIKIGDKCGAGATAFGDEIKGKYIDYNDEDNNNDFLYYNWYILFFISIFLM